MSEIQALLNTTNFETAAYKVFKRLVTGEAPGLMVLWGGEDGGPKVNKSYFLSMVERYEQGAGQEAALFPGYIRPLLKELGGIKYRCVRVKEWAAGADNPYLTPLPVAVTLALSGAMHSKGFLPGEQIVILCDDLHKFMSYNTDDNQKYLRSLASALDKQRVVTFIGASRLSWDAKSLLGGESYIPLGWD